MVHELLLLWQSFNPRHQNNVRASGLNAPVSDGPFGALSFLHECQPPAPSCSEAPELPVHSPPALSPPAAPAAHATEPATALIPCTAPCADSEPGPAPRCYLPPRHGPPPGAPSAPVCATPLCPWGPPSYHPSNLPLHLYSSGGIWPLGPATLLCCRFFGRQCTWGGNLPTPHRPDQGRGSGRC